MPSKDLIVSLIDNQTDNVVVVIDENFKIRNANQNFLNAVGYNLSEMKNEVFTKFVWEDDKQSAIYNLAEYFKGNNQKENFFLIDKNNDIKLFSLNGVVDKETSIPMLILIGRDVTRERMLIENEQIEEEKFKLLFENPGIAHSIVDLNLSYIEVNQTFCKMLGYSRRELLQKTPNDITFPEDKKTTEMIREELIKGKNYVQLEKRYIRKDGLIVWVLITTTLQKTSNGEPLYLLNTIQDISEKKYYQDKSAEHQRKYEALFYRSFHAIAYKKLVYDKNGNIQDYLIIDANPSFEKVTGFKKEEIINKPMKVKAQKHFHVSVEENMKRLKRYDEILKNGVDVHFKGQPSRTFQGLIDVYYYILDKSDNVIAVVFGDVRDGIIVTSF